MQLRWRAICQEGGDTEQSCALTTEGAEHLSKDDKDKDEGKNKDFEENLALTKDQFHFPCLLLSRGKYAKR